ncbi:MAG: DUF6114 domain-containing protein [Conexivisphaerales archaeon]
MTASEEKPTAAFILLLLSGVFIMLGSAILAFFMYPFMMGNYYYYGWMGGMMGRWYGYPNVVPAVFYWVSISGLVLGLIVLVAALMVNANPSRSTQWGIIALVASALSLLAMGGFFIGAILGIIGAALAIAYRPVNRRQLESSQKV